MDCELDISLETSGFLPLSVLPWHALSVASVIDERSIIPPVVPTQVMRVEPSMTQNERFCCEWRVRIRGFVEETLTSSAGKD